MPNTKYTPNSRIAAKSVLGNSGSALGGVEEIPVNGLLFSADGELVGSGVITLLNGTISDAVALYDFDLPEVYRSFRLEWRNYAFSVADALAFALSFDDGVTFLGDAVNSDSYRHVGFVTGVDAAPVVSSVYDDSLISFGNTQGPLSAISGRTILEFEPGSSANLSAGFEFSGNSADVNSLQFSQATIAVNQSATVPPTNARANKIRCLPYGLGDALSSSGHLITAGEFTLLGVL